MGYRNLVPPRDLKINFAPSPKQFELWKALQPECHLCGGEIKNVYIGNDANGNKQYVPECSSCGNRNIPQMVLGGGAAGGGKAQPLDAKILTPNGWITMGDVEVGTIVSTPDGKTAKVIAIHEQGMKKVNRITMSDGCTTECCDDHLWSVSYRRNKTRFYMGDFCDKIMDTLTIKKKLTQGKTIYVPIAKELEYGKKFEGSFMTAYSWGCYLRDMMDNIYNYKRCTHPNLPEGLKDSCLADRKNFLRGLLKWVKQCEKTGKYEFKSYNQKTAEDIAHILRSIGAVANITARNYLAVPQYIVRFSFDPRINPIKTSVCKIAKFRRSIKSVEELGEMKVCRCITLDSDEQLYITDGFIVTHNSYIGSAWLISSCIRFPNIRAVVARKTIKSLKESTFVTIKKVMKEWGLKEEENFTINNVEGTITFWNESIIMMKEMADLPADLDFSRFGSMEATIVFVDEASEISERAVDVMFSRIRWKTAETFKTPKMFLSCNPAACWLRSRFVQDDDGNPVVCRNGEMFVRFSIFDNPDDSFRQIYEASLNKIKDNATRERLLYGNWDFIEANSMALYKSFSGDKHLIHGLKENVYNPLKPIILGFDFNVFPHMTCEAVQIDWDNKNVYFIEEFLGKPVDNLNNTPRFAQYVKDKLLEYKHIGGVILTGDPAGLARSTQTEEGVNNFTIIQNCMENTVLRPKQNILAKQPPQKNRIDWINSLFDGLDGWDIYVDLRCRKLTEDLVYQLRNEDGTKNKQKVTDPVTKVRYEKYGHCFAAGTKVRTILGNMNIEDVSVGDYVLTRYGYRRVTFSGITGRNVLVKDYRIGTTMITCTPDHKFYTEEDGFVEIDSIVGSRSFVVDNAIRKLSVTSENDRIIDKVYDITVDEDHEFFANDILVHNCSDVADYVLCTMLSKSWLKYQRGGQSNVILTTSTIIPKFNY